MKAYMIDISVSIRVIAENEEMAVEKAIDKIAWNRTYLDTPKNIDVSEDEEMPYDPETEGDYEGSEIPIPQFLHSDLSSDWIQSKFSDEEQYSHCIEQTANSPENFELTIAKETGQLEVWQYQYDSELDAEKDWKMFQDNVQPAVLRAKEYVKYRGAEYLVREISYFEKADPTTVYNSMISTDAFNEVLSADIEGKNKRIRYYAQLMDEQIAFFMPEFEITDTSPEFVLKCLNNDYSDYTFTHCD